MMRKDIERKIVKDTHKLTSRKVFRAKNQNHLLTNARKFVSVKRVRDQMIEGNEPKFRPKKREVVAI